MSTAAISNATSTDTAQLEPLSLKDVLKFRIMRCLFYAQVARSCRQRVQDWRRRLDA